MDHKELEYLTKKYNVKKGWNDEVIFEMGDWIKWRLEEKAIGEVKIKKPYE